MALNEDFLQIGEDIIAAAFKVRKFTGSGLREKYYEAALAWELRNMGYKVERQKCVRALYMDEVVDDAFSADLVVDDRVIIEVKALKGMYEYEPRQLMTYLFLTDIKLGYLINFGVDDFRIGRLKGAELPLKYGIYRMVNGI